MLFRVLCLTAVFLAACGSDGAKLYGACDINTSCASDLACLGGVCLSVKPCSQLACDWNSEVCIIDRLGAAECVPGCGDNPNGCEDLDPRLMNAHPVVGFGRTPEMDSVRPMVLCACLEYQCSPICNPGEICYSTANDDDLAAQNHVTAPFWGDFTAAGGHCVPRG